MNFLGIYFGPKIINITETRGRNIVNKTQVLQSVISSADLDEKVPQDVKTIGIVALFKEELRKNKIEARDATLCLSGKDLIIRTFEMPVMPREELPGAVNFEVKKYIPFKVEDLISDFQVQFDKASRTNLILFMGIKKETFERYVSILSQSGLGIAAIEYSAFSLLRCLKLTGSSDNGVIGILGFDPAAEDEINFTVLENGFPLFSRDIMLSGESVETLQEKLKTEIRVSLDYYNRKFPAKAAKKIFLITSPDSRKNLEAALKEVGLAAHFIDLSRCTDKDAPYSLGFIKSFSSSLSQVIKTSIKLDILAVKEKVKFAKEKSFQLETLNLLKGFHLDYRVIALGLLIGVLTFSFGLTRIKPLEQEVAAIIGVRAEVATVNPQASYEELTGISSEYKRKLDKLDDLIRKQLYLTEVLDVVPRVIPDGVWLTDFSFSKKEEEKAELTLQGKVYLGDSQKEFQVLNKFLLGLKENRNFSKYFKEIEIASLDASQGQGAALTNFLISCRTYKKAK